jgi:hypothetical protein
MKAIVVGLAGAVALAGCFTTAADFRDEAETFIVGDPSIAEGLDVAIVSATCDEPDNQDPGTTFACTATDEAGDTWGFEVEIEESDRIGVTVSERP